LLLQTTMVANKLLSKTPFTMLFTYEYFFGILPHNVVQLHDVVQLDLAPSCTLTLLCWCYLIKYKRNFVYLKIGGYLNIHPS
jgi:hypothetical protein